MNNLYYLVSANKYLALRGYQGSEWITINKSHLSPAEKHEAIEVRRVDLQPNRPAVFDQEGVPCLNLWIPPTIQPRPNPYPRIEKILEYQTGRNVGGEWCPDPTGYQWLKNWLAFKVQNPAEKPTHGVLLTGPEGDGRKTLFAIVAEILGRANCDIAYPCHVRDSARRWKPSLLVYLGDVRPTQRLTSLLTSPEVPFGQKWFKTSAPNRTAFIAGSSEKVPVMDVHVSRFSTLGVRFKSFGPHWDLLCSFSDNGCGGGFKPDVIQEIEGFAHDLWQHPVRAEWLTMAYDGRESRRLNGYWDSAPPQSEATS